MPKSIETFYQQMVNKVAVNRKGSKWPTRLRPTVRAIRINSRPPPTDRTFVNWFCLKRQKCDKLSQPLKPTVSPSGGPLANYLLQDKSTCKPPKMKLTSVFQLLLVMVTLYNFVLIQKVDAKPNSEGR